MTQTSRILTFLAVFAIGFVLIYFSFRKSNPNGAIFGGVIGGIILSFIGYKISQPRYTDVIPADVFQHYLYFYGLTSTKPNFIQK